MSKFSINFKEILLGAHGNFEEQNKVLESFIMIINYCIVIINAYCNHIVQLMHSIIVMLHF